ncbi:MAG TPA: hypothetical protein VF881_16320 [Polyangiaceae bacterium]
MWARAARDLAAYREAVVNAVDGEDYPLSVRQTAPVLDPATGTMPVAIPGALGAVAGPASVLAHFHDAKLWKLRAMLIKGRLERRGDHWIFVATEYIPPPGPFAVIARARKATAKYLATRRPRPEVAFDVIQRIWIDAANVEDP